MLIEFSISNFCSIRKKQTFSLFAESSSSYLADNISWPGNGKIGVLRSAGVYGANASGKSNLLSAFNALVYIICNSGDLKDGDTIPVYKPYLLSDSNPKDNIEFEIEFFLDEKVRYIYSVSFNSKKILYESLDFYPSRSKANLFKREPEDTWDKVSHGKHYKGGKKSFPFFDNNSYISKAGNSADSPEFIRKIYNLFRLKIFTLEFNQLPLSNWKKDPDYITSMGSILSMIDTGITGFKFKEADTSNIRLPADMPDALKRVIIESKSKKPYFLHKGENNFEVEFNESMESAGTMKIFHLLPLLIDTFRNGGILIIDELDNSFHPHLAELIIRLFNSSRVNRNNAQLIFSTHNINLMSPHLLRRDQIWLTEKIKGETSLISVDDFDKKSVKIDSHFNKLYDDGRFGAIPLIDIDGISDAIIRRFS